MSWNIEIALIEITASSAAIDDFVPDSFCFIQEKRGFEDATSAAMGRQLAASANDSYVVLVDTLCRLTSYPNLFEDKGNGHIFRISDHPREQRFQDGEKVLDLQGIEAMVKFSGIEKTSDGEDAAIATILARTGVKFPFGLFDLEFRIYDLD